MSAQNYKAKGYRHDLELTITLPKCVFHNLREVVAELAVSTKHPRTLTRHSKVEAIPNNPKCIHKLAHVNKVYQ